MSESNSTTGLEDTTSSADLGTYDFDGEAVKRLVCPRCEAKLNAHCVTTAGRKSPVHSSRTAPLRAAYDAGWEARARGEARE